MQLWNMWWKLILAVHADIAVNKLFVTWLVTAYDTISGQPAVKRQKSRQNLIKWGS